MERVPIEVIYLIAFAGFVLYNWLRQGAVQRRRAEALARSEVESSYEGGPPGFEPAADAAIPGCDEMARAAPVPAARQVLRPEALRLHPARALLKDRRDLRRAVILSMVLGPCRGQDPPEQR